MKVEIKNNSKAAQGVLTVTGRVWIGPGKSREVEVESLSRVEDLPLLEVISDDAGMPDLSVMSAAKLKAFAKANGIDLGDSKSKDDILAAIELALEA